MAKHLEPDNQGDPALNTPQKRPGTDAKGQTHENTPGDKGQAHLSHPSVAAIVPAKPGGPAGPGEPNVLVSAKEPGAPPKVIPLDETGHKVEKKINSSD